VGGTSGRSLASITFVVAAGLAVACGKKGPPLPPLVKLPVAPANLTAERHGTSVDLSFTVPATNTDGTKPANVQRVDVYAYTGPASLTDDQVLKLGTRIASIDVKAPRDPNATVDEDESEGDVEAPQGTGLDQGAVASATEDLSKISGAPITATQLDPTRRGAKVLAPAASVPEPVGPLARRYVAVGVNKRGRHGPLSRRGAVPIGPPPVPPSSPAFTYNETSVTVTWMPSTGGTDAASPVPSSYHVYEVPKGGKLARLTKAPVKATRFVDSRVEWGAERCYVVRSVAVVDNLSVESDASASVCKTLVDTFPPAAPKGLTAVASEGSISLIWDPNDEADLAGYIVVRGATDGGALVRVTKTPIRETTYTDTVAAGARYRYAVQAVDKAGNIGPLSPTVDETSR
jgi:hypothetical protein